MITYLVIAGLIGAAWSMFGLGFLSVSFHYLPSGFELVVLSSGLFLAGVLSGFLLLGFQVRDFTPRWKSWINLNYLLFTPIGLLTALLVPGPLGLEGPGVPIGATLISPLAIAFLSNLVMLFGISMMGGVGIAIRRFSTSIQGSA
jgi:hypothetical protein